MPPLSWAVASALPSLLPAEIQVWRIDLEQPAPVEEQLAALLTPDEQARAARFASSSLRRRYQVARGALRWLLGNYLGRKPADLRLGYGPHGKPFVQDETGNPARLCFNLSHTQDMALLALAWEAAVGVDVEYTRRAAPELESIARRFFAAGEYRALVNLPAAERWAAFLRGWTRKEAFIKAVGDGLSHPLAAFEVTLEGEESAEILSINGDSAEAAHWTLAHLDPAPDYVGALAIRQRHWPIRAWRLPAVPTEG